VTTNDPAQRAQARGLAGDLEKDAREYPDERAELLLEAANQWDRAGEPVRALEIYDELIATASPEDAQWATVQRIEILERFGRADEARAEIDRLKRSPVHPGPAGALGELLEERGRLDEALTWFNIACRDLFEDASLDPDTVFARPELDGRARVRTALGLPPDDLDQALAESRGALTTMLGEPEEPPPAFFVRADLERARAEGFVSGDEPYHARVEREWRARGTRLAALPMTVDDLFASARAHGRDPRDDTTLLDHLWDRLDAGAPTVSWPPERNEPCWCGSGRKYKKCCGAAAAR